jgi:hypothetical protein
MVVYPLEFYRHSERQWKHRVKASTRSQRDDASTNRGKRMLSKLLPPGRKTIGVKAPSRMRRGTPLAVQDL